MPTALTQWLGKLTYDVLLLGIGVGLTVAYLEPALDKLGGKFSARIRRENEAYQKKVDEYVQRIRSNPVERHYFYAFAARISQVHSMGAILGFGTLLSSTIMAYSQQTLERAMGTVQATNPFLSAPMWYALMGILIFGFTYFKWQKLAEFHGSVYRALRKCMDDELEKAEKKEDDIPF